MTAVIDTLASFVVTLGRHATVLLSAVWLIERSALLHHPGWLELARRGALLGALLSTSLRVAPLGMPMQNLGNLARPTVATPAPTTGVGVVALRDSAIAASPFSTQPGSSVAVSRAPAPAKTPLRRTPMQIPHVAALALVSA